MAPCRSNTLSRSPPLPGHVHKQSSQMLGIPRARSAECPDSVRIAGLVPCLCSSLRSFTEKSKIELAGRGTWLLHPVHVGLGKVRGKEWI